MAGLVGRWGAGAGVARGRRDGSDARAAMLNQAAFAEGERVSMVVRVLFVCTGNICRSPTAEAVFRDLASREGLADRLVIDSAGTDAYHVGEAPDGRARAVARARGIALDHRARRVRPDDYLRFDYVLAMDEDNRRALAARCPRERAGVVRLFLDYAPESGCREVPDPYYGGIRGFEHVFDLCEAASKGLLAEIRRTTAEGQRA